MTEYIVAFPREEDTKTIRNLLVKNGFSVIGTVTSGSSALGCAGEMGGGVLVCGYQFRDMLFSQIRQNLSDRFAMILICSPGKLNIPLPENVEFLPLPLKVYDLVQTASRLEAELERKKQRRRSSPVKRSPEEQARILQAKEALMARRGMTESGAHRYLQKCSMENGRSLSETAEMILALLKEKEK